MARDIVGVPTYMWAGFSVTVIAAIVVDLGVLHRKAHRISLREALAESAGWIGLALVFDVWIYVSMGHPAGLEFLTSYVVEKSLSIDNIFVFLLIFQGMTVPAQSQHKVLYYGVVGALVMRAIFVFGGVALLNRFHFVLFVFGAILILTAVRMLLPGGHKIRPERNWLVRIVRGLVPVTTGYEGERFFLQRAGRWNATPLLLALVAVEATDILFAVDSVPAVLAITRDTFIAYSSNVFAILGLRALYFALADLLPRFRFLRPGLAAILLFTGAKMLGSERVHISTNVSLGIIVGIMASMIGASILWPQKKRSPE
jgi:tellurite resistance protein TerC